MSASAAQNKIIQEQKVRVRGRVVSELPNTKYDIEIEHVGVKRRLTGYISGKIRKNYIKIAQGDNVILELSPTYDPELKLGRIIYKVDPRRPIPPFALEGLVN